MLVIFSSYLRSTQMPILIRNKFYTKSSPWILLVEDLPDLGRSLKVPWLENNFIVP